LAQAVDPFITSTHIEVIIQKFDPFNELARYPVQRTRPEGGKYMYIYPDDIFVLDYFVYRMRETLSVPDNTWDILQEGHYHLQMCMEEHPEFYSTFKISNINFD
jgi:hypothetical protein